MRFVPYQVKQFRRNFFANLREFMGGFKNEIYLRRPGIEPGSTAWKAAMLTTIPPSLDKTVLERKGFLSFNFIANKELIEVKYRCICLSFQLHSYILYHQM